MQIFTEGKRAIKVGTKFGGWQTIGPVFFLKVGSGEKRIQRTVAVVCKCPRCSLLAVQTINNLKKCRSQNGCFRCAPKARDPIVSHAVYGIWMTMIQRCHNANNPNYKNYGGRGIVVCDEWRASSRAFVTWAENNGWARGLTIDRIDNDGGYRPDNCRFVSHKENCNNRRPRTFVTAFGKTQSISEWARDMRCRVSCTCLWYRLKKGWTPEVAIGKPPRPTTGKRTNHV